MLLLLGAGSAVINYTTYYVVKPPGLSPVSRLPGDHLTVLR